ncbi:hypothetical protein [Roseovarius sp.]|uniref:hypothetical protein n=1 Tax=Roseovarius sp. TaxID=1486281 RepID=UPI003D0D8FE1
MFVLIPGSKATIAALAALRANGWDMSLAARLRQGGHVLGFCGGDPVPGRRRHRSRCRPPEPSPNPAFGKSPDAPASGPQAPGWMAMSSPRSDRRRRR